LGDGKLFGWSLFKWDWRWGTQTRASEIKQGREGDEVRAERALSRVGWGKRESAGERERAPKGTPPLLAGNPERAWLAGRRTASTRFACASGAGGVAFVFLKV